MISEVHNIDCLEGLEGMQDNSIDCCITDPPYGIGYQSARRIDRKRKDKILNDEEPFTEWIKPLYFKMKDGGRLVCFYRWDVQEEFLQSIQAAGFIVKSQLVWDKVIHGMGDLKGEFAPQHELMIYATKGRYTFEGKRPKTVYRCKRVDPEIQIHPNEKPVELIQAIMRDISTKNDLFIEPFGGSMASVCAAYSEGRKCIAFELHYDYYLKGKQRFELFKQQQKLF